MARASVNEISTLEFERKRERVHKKGRYGDSKQQQKPRSPSYCDAMNQPLGTQSNNFDIVSAILDVGYVDIVLVSPNVVKCAMAGVD